MYFLGRLYICWVEYEVFLCLEQIIISVTPYLDVLFEWPYFNSRAPLSTLCPWMMIQVAFKFKWEINTWWCALKRASLKVGYSQKVFSIWSHPQKINQITVPQLFNQNKKVEGHWFGSFFWGIGQDWKYFLRLNHL